MMRDFRKVTAIREDEKNESIRVDTRESQEEGLQGGRVGGRSEPKSKSG